MCTLSWMRYTLRYFPMLPWSQVKCDVLKKTHLILKKSCLCYIVWIIVSCSLNSNEPIPCKVKLLSLPVSGGSHMRCPGYSWQRYPISMCQLAGMRKLGFMISKLFFNLTMHYLHFTSFDSLPLLHLILVQVFLMLFCCRLFPSLSC